jgi:Family of unknown function (DUF6152)
MRTHRKLAAFVAAVLVLMCIDRGVSAHHSMAGYDDTKKVTLTGTVSEYKWRNPHVWVVWDVKDENGKTVQWAGELPAINTDQALGLTKNSLKVGDEIAVTINPSKLGTTDGRVLKIIKNGAVVVDISLMRAQ